MGLWAQIERRMWTGTVLKEFVVAGDKWRGVTRRVTALLTERESGRRFILRVSYRGFLSASVQYVELDRDEAIRLKTALDEAITEMP